MRIAVLPALAFALVLALGPASAQLDTPGFEDDFEGGLSAWTIEGDSQSPPDANAFDTWLNASGSLFDGREGTVARSHYCDSPCIMTLNPMNISGFADPVISFDRRLNHTLDSDGPGADWVSVEVYDGDTWHQIRLWDDEDEHFDGDWHSESQDVSEWAGEEFSVRFTAQQSKDNEDVAIDNFEISSSGFIVIPEPRPVADAGPDLTVDEGELVVLDGSNSSDPDGAELTYS